MGGLVSDEVLLDESAMQNMKGKKGGSERKEKEWEKKEKKDVWRKRMNNKGVENEQIEEGKVE